MAELNNFTRLIDAHGMTMHRDQPPIAVGHPNYGLIGNCVAQKGFVPQKGHWASTNAILRDADRNVVKMLRRIEDNAPMFLKDAILMGVRRLQGHPFHLPVLLGAISNYDGIVAARGSGAMQDVWMAMTATQTPVTLSWYDLMAFASWTPMTNPTITAYTNAGTGGAVLDATSNGSWLTNPAGTNDKYIVSMGLTTTSITGFSLAMLYDCLWAGSYSLITNATINPTTDVTVTRYASTTAGNAEYAGGNMMQMTMTSTLTHTVAPVVTTTYTNQAGTTGKTNAITCPATGVLVNRIIGNTTQATATVITSTPFMPLTNGGDSGVTKLEQVVISGGTATVGTANHKIVRPLVLMPFIAAASFIEQDTTLNIGNMVELKNVSQVCGCIGWNVFSGGTTAASMSAFMRTVEG